jgi:hypothetical protein
MGSSASHACTHTGLLPWQLLRDVHNFNTMMAVDAALQHTAVERLKKTFELMSDRKRQAWVSLRLGLSTTPNQYKIPHIPLIYFQNCNLLNSADAEAGRQSIQAGRVSAHPCRTRSNPDRPLS